MGKRTLSIAAAGLIMLGLLMSCSLSGMSDVEFAKELLNESAGVAGDSTGLYTEPVAGKSGGSTGEGLTITFELPDGNPPETGPYIITLTFEDYTPSFAANSLVSGVLIVTVTLDLFSADPSVTLVFDGDLTVVGEHRGNYDYEAELIIDLSTGEYTYSGNITIEDKVHKTG